MKIEQRYSQVQEEKEEEEEEEKEEEEGCERSTGTGFRLPNPDAIYSQDEEKERRCNKCIVKLT